MQIIKFIPLKRLICCIVLNTASVSLPRLKTAAQINKWMNSTMATFSWCEVLQGLALCTWELFPNVRCHWRCCTFSRHTGSPDACQWFLGDLYNMWWLDAGYGQLWNKCCELCWRKHFWRERDILECKIHFGSVSFPFSCQFFHVKFFF